MKNLFKLITIIVSLTLVSVSQCFAINTLNGCSITNTTIQVRKAYVCLGDSITVGTGSESGFGYRGFLQQKLGVTSTLFKGSKSTTITDPSIKNISPFHEGIGGNNTTQMLSRLPGILSTYMNGSQEKAMIIHAGTNDIFQDVPIQDMVDNVVSMLDLINAYDSQIYIYVCLIIPVTYQNDDPDITTFNSLLSSELSTYEKDNLTVVDLNNAFKANPNWEDDYLPVDGTHPNDAGYQVMANALATAIQANQ